MNHQIIYTNINQHSSKSELLVAEKEYKVAFCNFALFWFEAQVKKNNNSTYKVQDKSIVGFHFESQDGGIWELR